MLWIKRNLFLVGFLLVACVLLAGGLFYLWSSNARNTEMEAQVAQSKQDLETLLQQHPFPSPTNIAVAKAQLARLRQAITNAQPFFQPVPCELITNQQPFKALLNRTLWELQQKAGAAGVALPKNEYAFSFEAQQKQLNLVPASFGTLCEQLAEIKAICLVLFDAKVNRLAHVKRWRVSPDDPVGSPDYHDYEGTVTNQPLGLVANTYEVAFHCFSSELAAALEGFYKSPYGLSVKSLAALPAPPMELNAGGPAVTPHPGAAPRGAPSQTTLPRQAPGMAMPPPGFRPPPPAGGRFPGAMVAPPRETLQVVLNEQLLNVTLRMEVDKVEKADPPAK
jgi:hypothetical protein